MAKKKSKKKANRGKVSRGKSVASKISPKKRKSFVLRILALIINAIIFPGIGSMLAGKYKEGTWQLVLIAVALITYLPSTNFLPLSVLLFLIAWIWGIITGIKLLQ